MLRTLAMTTGLALALSGCGSVSPAMTKVSYTPNGPFTYESDKNFGLIRGEGTTPAGLSFKFEAQGVDATTSMIEASKAMSAQSAMFQAIIDKLLPLIAGAAGGGLPIPLSPKPR